ncbi:hypothetical protein NDU88_007148 [Pleurodeles waltl]|uniref:Secreted protein n=1 Tax=Pleurodeles waltl TaxID=8319 RepID=A0AAV7UQ76_PLEWA|nr:hypothetical protein NDU88_007148 [Pleurodeles waltl]
MVAGTRSTPLRTILLCVWGRCRCRCLCLIGSRQKKLAVRRKGEQLLSDRSVSRAMQTDDNVRNPGWNYAILLMLVTTSLVQRSSLLDRTVKDFGSIRADL